jgi:hypothetical protein
VAGGLWNRVMIVVPSFAKREQGNPKIVLGGIIGKESPRSPYMSSRVYKPGGMKTDHRSQKDHP